MYMRAIATLKLQAAAGMDSGDTAAQTEIDFNKYFVNPGKREMKAVVSPILSSTDSGVFNYKLQESNTTVDSDFSDISGASITQVGSTATPAPEAIHFFTAKRYVRGYQTIVGGTWVVTALLFAVKRDA